ncbi:hypothetical protein TBLA_0C05760 [Henningerozyma blattae CBS 6284]|uniref:Ebp2p n=1 Tax=Henningerozyma blattae (strain ATCC 34711 / CBS 6284 / DSM 70876 / NBRC 10599 / NRRL Y-10934 / UCD 77-7) TaxID=1071380 RepID=I2H1X2_HENB6|nr:hypothetical protein TBLA_0C05760 [Tetrapisispora blattae CBS 6284]CCH60374.1 hypothetical protein TBLA_0C05760 [Tetrapisispora blattae CBS 6284]
MAKGYKLKELLAHQKEVEKQDKIEQEKLSKKNEHLKKAEPKVVNSEDVKKSAIKKAITMEPVKDTEEYESNALSHKEKRKLKKQLKKMSELDTKKEKEEKENIEEQDDDEIEEEDDDEEKRLDLEKLSKSDSESESDDDDEEEDDEEAEKESESAEEEEEEEEVEDVPLSDVEFDSDADVVPHHKLTINNTKAMKNALERIQLPWKKHSFQEHQTITSKSNTDEGIKDIYDDTERELAFYKQSLEAVQEAREELNRLKVPFKRPLDYFAEMVKNDEHMDKIKGKLVQEASEKKAREEARRQRNLKKFGKQVQVATLQKRQIEKRDTLEKIKSLKKKRKHSEIGGEEFNVGIEEAAASEESNNRFKRAKANSKRENKNTKYGFGGMKRFKRKNDAESSMNITGFSQRKMKGKSVRPGKSRRR